ncbi:hypothetical protein LUZ60_013169 [Juncus effusus]|nr:hypothetical protein LUZ60_013169 [Juncus effusus]
MAKKKKNTNNEISTQPSKKLPFLQSLTISTALFLSLFALLIRVLVSLGPYSGQAAPPKHGDYEAQRHWMEITIHLPPSDWYRNSTENDLLYWGLDYPPLSGYQSWVHGMILNATVPESVELGSSRGFESHESKLVMRWTVLLSDLIFFFPSALIFIWVYSKSNFGEEKSFMWLLAMILLNPGLILIDHGHFQYNCISLGLTLGAISAILSDCEILASVLFTLAINHKHMSLYYAPAFFGYLFGKCLKSKYPIIHVIKLGFVVLATFALVWWPYIHSLDSFLEVISRLAPFDRGIYEDYVANFWCSTSILIKWKRLFNIQPLKIMSLISTIFTFLPSMVQQVKYPSKLGFLYSLLNSSFSFYLFSYQVHEKSILLPLLPVSLLALKEPQLYALFILYALLSMFPLIIRDKILLQYIAIISLFFLIFFLPAKSKKIKGNKIYPKNIFWFLPFLGFVILHVIYLFLKPPEKYPYLFEALIMILCFSQFLYFAFYSNKKQWILSRFVSEKKDL